MFYQDQPEDGEIYSMRVREGDLLLLASDGLFDNLFQEEILTITRNFTKNNTKSKASAKELARQIANAACNKSKRNGIKTPFNMKKATYICE